VIEDARAAGAAEFVLGGDYTFFGAFPREVVERLHELNATWIRGNTDRWLDDPADMPQSELNDKALAFCRDRLGTLARDLAALAPTASVDGALVCHASPRSDMQSFTPSESEADASLLAPEDPDVIVFGHTHLQFRRPSGHRTLVNPGSVGLPFDGDRRAAYSLWHSGSDFELRRVGYDSAAYAADVHDRMSEALGETVETLVRRVEQAAFVN
jgi:predicted phosphodiesterase